MPLPVKIILIVLAVILVLFIVLIFIGRRMQKKQASSQEAIEAASQTLSMLIIDKKRMKLKDSNLPKMVVDQVPKYMRMAKLPLVKAKVGPKVMTLIADAKVFDALPVKTEVKAVVSGLYITEIKFVRGKTAPQPKKKQGFIRRAAQKAYDKSSAAAAEANKTTKKKK